MAGPAATTARERIGEAMLDLVTSCGYGATTIDSVLDRAGVDRAEFDRLFEGKEDCFLQLYEEMTARFNRCVFAAYEVDALWCDRLRAAAYAAARWIRDHPRETRYGTLEMLAAGEVAQAHREATLRRCVAMVDDGRQELDDPDSISPAVAEGTLGAIAETLMKNLQRGTGARGEELVPELMYLAVRPYLGHEAAREELTIPPPPEADPSHG